MKSYLAHRGLRAQTGSSILEALVAILIFSIGVIALMGLQAVSIKNVADSKYRADASFLANQLIGQMWTDVPNLASYATASHPQRKEWDEVVKGKAGAPGTLPNASTTVEVVGSVVTITIKWQTPGQDEHAYKTAANINL